MFSPPLDIWFGDYSIPQRNQTVIQDVGGRGTVSGTAYYDNGATAAGVEVKIYDSYPRGTTTTDAEGFYSFANVPTGRVNVEAQVHGAGPVYYTSSGGYLTQNDGTVTVNINSPARCNLEGTLYDYTGQPLQGGWVKLSTYNSYDSGVSTNVNGLYSFTAIQPDFGRLSSYTPWIYDDDGNAHSQSGFRYFGIGTCPSGGGPVQYDLPLYRYDYYNQCGGGVGAASASPNSRLPGMGTGKRLAR
jgi:hypothetical protein